EGIRFAPIGLEAHRSECGETPCRPPTDDTTVAVDDAGCGEVTGDRDAVVDVRVAPRSTQQVAIGPAEAGRAPVVDVRDREPARGPELHAGGELRTCRGGRAAVDPHHQGRTLVLRADVVATGRQVEEGVRL